MPNEPVVVNELDDTTCVETYERTKERLEEIERQLGDRLGFRKHIRRELLALDRKGQLIEDELVADWYDAYASYQDWIREDSPPRRETRDLREQDQRAAESGPSTFVDITSVTRHGAAHASSWLSIPGSENGLTACFPA